VTDVDVESELTSYTSESSPSAGTATTDRPARTAPGGATGRRKEAVARVRIVPGTGQWIINGRTLENYFPNKVHQQIVNEAFKAIGADDQYDVVATVAGGGHSAQAEAMRHGIARALLAADGERRSSLKRAGFLTRDARKKERKKYGQPGARKRFQYSKR